MNRRGFLGSIAGFAAACTLDPERALWVPGAKTISIPRPEGISLRYIDEWGKTPWFFVSEGPGMFTFSQLQNPDSWATVLG